MIDNNNNKIVIDPSANGLNFYNNMIPEPGFEPFGQEDSWMSYRWGLIIYLFLYV